MRRDLESHAEETGVRMQVVLQHEHYDTFAEWGAKRFGGGDGAVQWSVPVQAAYSATPGKNWVPAFPVAAFS